MEMKASVHAQQLNPFWSRLAGIASGVLALAGAAALLAYLLGTRALGSTGISTLAALIGAMALVVLASIQLVRRQEWAQPILLGFWLAMAVADVILGVTGMLYGIADWWAALTTLHPAAVLTPLLVACAALVMALVAASSGNSRRRYGSFVLVSIAAAVAVVVVINIIAQQRDNFFHRNVEMLGQYRLSDRSTKVVTAVNEPVTITCIYTSIDPNKQTDDRRARVLELLGEMRDLNPKINVVNGSSDTEKVAILARLTSAAQQKASAHLALLNEFGPMSKQVVNEIDARRAAWDALAGHSYLDQWGVPASVSSGLKTLAGELDKSRTQLDKDLAGLIDPAKTLDEVVKTAEASRDAIKSFSEDLGHLQKVSENAIKNRTDAAKSVQASYAAVEAAGKVLEGDANNPAPMLKDFIAAMTQASEQVAATAQHLDEIGGSENADYVRQSRAWLMETGAAPVVIGGVSYATSTNITRMYAATARSLEQFKGMAETLARGGTAEFQTQNLTEIHNQFPKLLKSLSQLGEAATVAIAKLSSVDPETQQILAELASGKYFEPIVKPLSDFADKAAKLPPLKASTLADDLRDENIVLVETGDKASVVTFEDVWPLRSRPSPMAAEAPSEQRAFNGEAITSKILSMTQPPFARVLITYLEIPQNPMMGGRSPNMTPASLTELRRRLELANVKVDVWNLAADMPRDANAASQPSTSLPTVLLVLPPPVKPMQQMMRPEQPGSGFGPEHVAKVRRAIDAGAGAIFLANYTFPAGMGAPTGDDYGWNKYLADWGIQARNTYVIIPGQREESGRGEEGKDQYQLSLTQFSYLPLNTFSDQPVGKPLQGQRTLWYLMCPVAATEAPPGVEVRPVLTVPASWNTTWATQNFREIVTQIQQGDYIAPNYRGGDLRTPFDVILAASRSGGEGKAPARIVVAGIASSLQDEYLTERVYMPDEKGRLTTMDAPKADADVIVNAAYWISGREDYIAAGPTQLQPVKVIESPRLLWALCVIALPLGVLVLGGVVLVIRKL